MQRAYLSLLNRIKKEGIAPQCQILYNECSERMKTLICEKIALELVSPHCHCRNVAEVAIKAFKQHFLSIIAGVATDLPMHQWERLLPQDGLTLNLLRKSNTNTTVSAYAAMFGPFDYNRIPLVPMGCAIFINEKSGARASWDNNTVYSLYLYMSPEHYQAHVCRVKNTNIKQI